MVRGHLIVLEGIDGSGTTTQAAKLKSMFVENGLAVHVTAEPSGGPIGSLIRQVLSGRVVTRTQGRVIAPSWKVLSLLFASDRQDHLEAEIEPNLRDGVNVICDRYLYSSVVYQSLTSGSKDSAQWIIELNRYVRKPDLVLYLRVDPEKALDRRRTRGLADEIFDNPDLQHRLALGYDTLSSRFDDLNIVTIDANGAIENVSQDCWQKIEELRASGAPS